MCNCFPCYVLSITINTAYRTLLLLLVVVVVVVVVFARILLKSKIRCNQIRHIIHIWMLKSGRRGGGGWGGGAINCHYDKGSRMLFFSFFAFDRKLYLSPTTVAASGPAVAGGADADGRGSGGTFQMCSCGITAVSSCCAGCARVANL